MHFIKNGHYYKILHDGKYYRLINPRRLFLFTIIPYPADATVTLTAAGYTQVGNTISVRAGTQVSWSVSKAGIPTSTGTETITEPKTIYVTIGYPSGEVLFESSTPGTYTLAVTYPCTVHVDIVGGGGGGKKQPKHGAIPENYRSGASGGYVYGTINIDSSGLYEVVVGGGGAGTSVYGQNAQPGGQSSFFGQIAYGGTGGGAGHKAGEYLITLDTLTGVKGADGVNATSGTAQGGASRYNGYGKGGNANSSGGKAGTNGYVRIYVE